MESQRTIKKFVDSLAGIVQAEEEQGGGTAQTICSATDRGGDDSHPRPRQTEVPRTSPLPAEGERGATSSVNHYGSSTQNINSIITSSGPANVAQQQTIYQTTSKENK